MKTILITLLLILPLMVNAQTSKKQRKVEFQLASASKFKQSNFFLVAEKDTEGSETIPVTISSWQLSPKYKLQAGKKYHLYSSVSDKKAILSFTTKPGAKKVIAILLKQTKPNAGKWKLHQLNSGATKFKAGQRLVFNLSNTPIQIKYAGKVVTIPAKTQKSLAIPKSLNNDYVPAVGMFLADKEKKKWRRFLSSRWVANKHTRTILFVYAERSTKSLTYHGIDQDILPDPAKTVKHTSQTPGY